MIQHFLKTHATKLSWGLLLLVLAFSAGYGSFSKVSNTLAGASDVALSGYMWSSNIGWIHMNGSGYGVQEDLSTGKLSGYAWSSNIGWITFEQSDLVGCPSGSCFAAVDLDTGDVGGWARACAAFADKDACSGALDSNAGGWDGWIHLSGSTYGVTQDTSTCAWSGQAWGGDGIGWISFSGSGYGVQTSSCSLCTPHYECSGSDLQHVSATCVATTIDTCTGGKVCSPGSPVCIYPSPQAVPISGTSGHLTARPNLVRKGNTVKLYWNFDNVNSCQVDGSNGDHWSGASSGASGATSAAITHQTFYTLTCQGLDSSTFTEPTTVNITPEYREQ